MINLKSNKNYYGLVSGLHGLVIGKKGDLRPSDFRNALSAELEPEDHYQFLLPFYLYDNRNFLAIKFGKGEFNPQGNLKEEELTLLLKNNFSEDKYFEDFLNKVDIEEEGISAFKVEYKLTQHYYDYLSEFGNEFIQNWVDFELTLKNLTAVYAIRNLNLEDEGQFIEGGYFSGLELKRINIADLDAQYPHLKRKYEALEIIDPIQRKLKVDQIKWDFLDENTFFNYFTIEKVIAYTLKLIDIEVWHGINENGADELFNNYVEQINNELETLIK